MSRPAKDLAPDPDHARAFLRERGCPDHVVDGGLAGLVASWEKFAAGLADGYGMDLDEYRNDLDVRQILAEAWSLATVADVTELQPRLVAADAGVRAATEPSELCIWGSRNATRRRYLPTRNWWYYRVPKRAGDAFKTDFRQVR